MSNFKAGDKVVCVDNGGEEVRLTLGKEYRVSFCEGATCLEVEGSGALWLSHRFELAQQCNGVDTNGKPISFDKSMLTPFMRVVDTRGAVYIVTTNCPDGDTVIVGSEGSSSFYLDKTECYGYPDYVAQAVYDAPDPYDCLDFSKKGGLIWKHTEPKTAEQVAQEAALAARNKAIEEAEKALKLAQDKLSELKQSF